MGSDPSRDNDGVGSVDSRFPPRVRPHFPEGYDPIFLNLW
jgi:hypothetical protein